MNEAYQSKEQAMALLTKDGEPTDEEIAAMATYCRHEREVNHSYEFVQAPEFLAWMRKNMSLLLRYGARKEGESYNIG